MIYYITTFRTCQLKNPFFYFFNSIEEKIVYFIIFANKNKKNSIQTE